MSFKVFLINRKALQFVCVNVSHWYNMSVIVSLETLTLERKQLSTELRNY